MQRSKTIVTPMGAIWWGTRETCPPHFFRQGEHNMSCPAHLFLFRFCIWRGFKNKSDVCHVLWEELFMLNGRWHIANLMLKQSLVWQWCSRDRNLLDQDFIKNYETWSLRSRLQNLCILSKFLKNVINSDFFLQISGIFPTCFGCFLPTNTTNKKSLNYTNFYKPFLCNMQSLETWNLRDWDLKPSRPRPRLARMGFKTPSVWCGISDSVSL